jgi:hypothetical protein
MAVPKNMPAEFRYYAAYFYYGSRPRLPLAALK